MEEHAWVVVTGLYGRKRVPVDLGGGRLVTAKPPDRPQVSRRDSHAGSLHRWVYIGRVRNPQLRKIIDGQWDEWRASRGTVLVVVMHEVRMDQTANDTPDP